MAIKSLVIPPFYLAGALSAEGLVLPISANDAATICALLGTGNHTYLRISSNTSLEVVKAQCTGSVVQIDRAINESFAVAHPLGACVTVDMDTICAMSDVLCQELPNCTNLGASVRTALLADATFLTSLAANDAFETALCGNATFQSCLQNTLLAAPTFLPTITNSVKTALLADSAFVSNLAGQLVANATFVSNLTATVASNPSLLTAVANSVLNSPNFCASVTACNGGGAGPGSCPAPNITSVLTPVTATVGVPYTGTFSVSPATSVTVTNLPSGLSAAYNNTTGVVTISGTPTVAGTASLSVVANNTCGTLVPTVRTLALGSVTVAAGAGPGACPQPALLSTLTPSTAQAGVPYTGTADVANVTGVTFSNVPSWATATFNQGTQQVVITGTPTSAMTGVTMTLTNACGGTLTTSVASGVVLGNLTITAPTLVAGNVVIERYGCDDNGTFSTLYSTLKMGTTATPAGTLAWELTQSTPQVTWNLPSNPNNVAVSSLPGFNYGATHTLRASGPWGVTNTIGVGKTELSYGPCNPGGA